MNHKSKPYQRYGKYPYRPREPRCGSAAAYPTYSSPLFPCPFCHNTTLQHHCIPNVAKSMGERTSQNAVKAKFGIAPSRSSRNAGEGCPRDAPIVGYYDAPTARIGTEEGLGH